MFNWVLNREGEKFTISLLYPFQKSLEMYAALEKEHFKVINKTPK